MQFWELEPEWDDDSIKHIARHDVEPEEVEEIVYKIAIPHGLFALGVAAYTAEVSAMAQKLTAAQRRALKREAVGWDELSDEDFARQFAVSQPVKVRVRRPPPKTLTVALDEQTLNRLKRIARHKQVRARHLVAMGIAERLTQERPARK